VRSLTLQKQTDDQQTHRVSVQDVPGLSARQLEAIHGSLPQTQERQTLRQVQG
jgi:hypothetical protein